MIDQLIQHPMPSRKKPILGTVLLNPNCMEEEDGLNFPLAEGFAVVLRFMFSALKHDVKVYVSGRAATKVLARNDEAIADIMCLVNVAFAAFYASAYNSDKTLNMLEDKRVIPLTSKDD